MAKLQGAKQRRHMPLYDALMHHKWQICDNGMKAAKTRRNRVHYNRWFDLSCRYAVLFEKTLNREYFSACRPHYDFDIVNKALDTSSHKFRRERFELENPDWRLNRLKRNSD